MVLKQSRFHKQFFTLPNILSYLRFALIPVFLWIYCGKGNYTLAAWLMAISAATDVIDGWIARQFHLVTDWGKIIDPFADKLTQIAIAFCLAWRYPTVWFLLGFLVAKEFYMGLIGLIFIKKTDTVEGSEWHGKFATVLFFLISLIMLVAPSLPLWSIQLMVGLECAVLLVSMILYSLRYQRLYHSLPRKS
jgi:cardiolipin synthase